MPRGRARGAHAGADAAPRGLTRKLRAEVAADVDDSEGGGARVPTTTANGGASPAVGGTIV